MPNHNDEIHGSCDEKMKKSSADESILNLLSSLEEAKVDKKSLSDVEVEAMIQKISTEASPMKRAALIDRFAKVSGKKTSAITAEVARILRDAVRHANAHTISDWWDSLSFGLPEGYGLGADGVVKYGAKADDRLTIQPFWVNAIIENLSEGTKELELAWKTDFGQESLIVPRVSLSNTRDFAQTMAHGTPLRPSMILKALDYLVDFADVNSAQLEKNKKYLSRKPGWIQLPEDKGNRFAVYAEDVIFSVAGERGAEQHLGSKGTIDGWMKIRPFVEKSPMMAFLMASSLAAPLLEILQASGFLVDQYGGSGTGKTTSLCAAASMFGRPGGQNGAGLVTPWNATPTFVETMLGFFSHLPLFCMDSHELKDEPLEKMAYMVANGAGRGRGAKDGGVRARGEWRSVLLSDGEYSMYERITMPGAKARVISLRGAAGAGLTKEDIGPLNEIIHGNYGVVAPLYIRKIQELEPTLMEMFKSEKKRYADKATNSTEARIGAYFAAISVAIHVVSKVENMEWFADVSAEAIEIAWNLAVTDSREESNIEKAIKLIRDWISEKRVNFVTSKAARFAVGSDCVGRIEDKDFVAINGSKLDEYLKTRGFKSPKMLFQALKDADVIDTTQADFRKSVRMQGDSVHSYVFKWQSLYPSESSHEDNEASARMLKSDGKVVPLLPKDCETVTGQVKSIREITRGETFMTAIELEDQGFYMVTSQYHHVLEKLAYIKVGTEIGDEIMIYHKLLDITGNRYVLDVEVKKKAVSNA